MALYNIWLIPLSQLEGLFFYHIQRLYLNTVYPFGYFFFFSKMTTEPLNSIWVTLLPIQC